MTGMYGTGYLETEALLAAQSGDLDNLAQLVARLGPGEKIVLRSAARVLIDELEK